MATHPFPGSARELLSLYRVVCSNMGGRFRTFFIMAACLSALLGWSGSLRAQQNLQSYLNSLATGRHGSVVVINPSTGGILAAWNLRQATRDAYPPGSTAKIVEAAAALEEGVMTPRARIICRRIPPLLGSAYHCTHPPAPQGFTVSSALANSCNYFFTLVSMRLNAESLLHWYSVFGFGAPVELDGSAASPGDVRLARGAREKALEAIGVGRNVSVSVAISGPGGAQPPQAQVGQQSQTAGHGFQPSTGGDQAGAGNSME